MSAAAMGLIVIVLSGALIISSLWLWLTGEDKARDWEREERQRALMQEVRRHDPTRN